MTNPNNRLINPIHFDTFNRTRPDFAKLDGYGFVNNNSDEYQFSQNILNDDFRVEMFIFADGTTTSRVIDLLEEDEYINVSIASVQGEFVNSVRVAYQAVLEDIKQHCFIPTRFANGQTNRLADWILAAFGDEPDEPFAKYKETGVFRNPENQKWYGLVTQVSKRTLEPELKGAEAKQKIEIINIKVDSTAIDDLHTEDGIYPAYHMNKKHWVSIVLDDRLSDDRLFELVKKSRDFTLNKQSSPRKSKAKQVRTEPKHWVIPANPQYYDVIKVFSEKDVVYWYQGANFIVGDIVYMYLGKPYSAIMYQCTVIEVNLESDKLDKKGNPIKRMNLKRVKSFDKTEFPLSQLKQLGLTSIRGARGVPEAVVKAIG